MRQVVTVSGLAVSEYTDSPALSDHYGDARRAEAIGVNTEAEMSVHGRMRPEGRTVSLRRRLHETWMRRVHRNWNVEEGVEG